MLRFVLYLLGYHSFKSDEDWLAFLQSRGVIVNRVTRGQSHNRPEFVIERRKEGYKRFLIIDDEPLFYITRYQEIAYNYCNKFFSLFK